MTAATWVTPVIAAVHISRPAGWNGDEDASAEARARARDWARLSGYTLVELASPSATDSFAETLAVFELDNPMSDIALNELDAGHAALVEAVEPLQAAAADVEGFAIRSLPAGTVLQGHWLEDNRTVFAALAPSGPTQSLVVLAVKASEATLYRSIFDDIVEDLDGLAPPLVPFPVGRWRIGVVLGWIALVVATYGFVAQRADRSQDYRGNARRTAIVVIPAAVIVAVFVHAVLHPHEPALIAAHVDRFALAMETGLVGAAMAGLVIAVGGWLGRERVVQSAPTASAFAGRSHPPRVPRLYDPTGVDLVRVASVPREAISVPEASDGEIDRHSLADLARDPAPANLIAAAESTTSTVDDDLATRPHRTVGAASPPRFPPAPAKPPPRKGAPDFTARDPSTPPPRRSQSPAGPLPIPVEPEGATVVRARPRAVAGSKVPPPPKASAKIPRPKPPGSGSTPVTGIAVNRGRNRGEDE